MKFPKSMHAEGWASHLDTKADASADGLGSSAPLHAAKAPPLKSGGAGVKISATQPLHATEAPRAEPAFARAPTSRPAAATVQRDRPMNWMIPAGAGVAIIAAVAIWAMNRPGEAPVTSPALVVGSVEPQAEVAAATPMPEAPAAASQVEDGTPATTVAAAPEPAPAVEPASRLGPPVTTTRPAVEPRPVAQAPVPAARPDMVGRAAPNSPAATLQPPPATVATAPVDAQPLGVPPGSGPIVMPPTAAGPVTAPQALTPPVAATTPDTTASSVSPGSPPLAQAQVPPQPQPLPAPEDSGITVKVRMALAADATLAAVPIAVSTDHGVVKLEGQAPDAPTRERATVVAASAGGVKAVDNRLTLPPPTVVGQLSTVQ